MKRRVNLPRNRVKPTLTKRQRALLEAKQKRESLLVEERARKEREVQTPTIVKIVRKIARAIKTVIVGFLTAWSGR